MQDLNNPIIDQLKDQIKPAILEQLKIITNMLTEEDKNETIVPIILENLHDDSDEEKRILGLELLNSLAPTLGKEICHNFLIHEMVSLQDDHIYRVRKATVLNMVNISKTV